MTTSLTADGDLREVITAERRELVAVLSGLAPEAWDAPSLCAGWRVREVVAHITMPFRYSSGRFVLEIIKDRGKFNRMADRCARRDAARPPADLLAALRDNVENPWKPPGGGFEGALVHDVMHGLDITVPLDLGRRVPADRLLIVLSALSKPQSLKHFGIDLSGLELRADDMEWSFGSGSLVQGHGQELALALSGRPPMAGQLQGERAHTAFP
jgi:uncharacterized protein (TIGR03083 family)